MTSTSSQTLNVSLRDRIAPPFYDVHRDIRDGLHSVYWLKGGRGSTKSSFVAIEIVLGIVLEPDANAIVLRKVGDTIRTSVLENILWAIDTLGWTDQFRHTKAPAVVTYRKTGQKIIFKGLDDSKKLKSIKLKNGYFKFLWFEEADEFDGMDEIRNVEQSVLRGGDKFVEFITYNPPNDPANWVNVEADLEAKMVEEDPDYVSDRYIHHSTYLGVPPEWLGPKFLKDAERLKRKNPLAYDHEYMGLAVGRAEQIIFHGYWTEREFNTPDLSHVYQNRFFNGADWGFSQDPVALIRAFILFENGERNLYIDHEAGGVGIELKELKQLFSSIPGARQTRWYGDNSRPETISYVSGEGFNIAAAPKWDGSVEDGIEYLKAFDNIFIHPRCVKLIEEMKKYSYKVDKHTKEILPIIVDKWNHYIDALRYALAEYITREVSILDVL